MLVPSKKSTKLFKHHSSNPLICERLQDDGNNQDTASYVTGKIHIYGIVSQIRLAVSLVRQLYRLVCRITLGWGWMSGTYKGTDLL